MTELLTPAPGAAPATRMVAAQAAAELRAWLRNGEQLLLTLIIPTLLLALFSLVPLFDVGTASRVDFLAPGVIALAVMSTSFTGLAIATGFERRYGVLKQLGATPLPRWGLLTAKSIAVLGVEVLQVTLLVAVAWALGWQPRASALGCATIALFLLLGTVAFSGLGLLMAGTLRAEATLAAANLVYVVLLALGGVVFPLSRFPGWLQPVLELLPISALAEGLRAVLRHGEALPGHALTVLAVWAVVALTAASLTFKWD